MRSQLKVVVVTGGIACGKSTVTSAYSERLGDLGASFSADAVVAELLTSREIISIIGEELGGGFVSSDGTIDRASLRKAVFSDDSCRGKLESILHPRVFAEFEARLKASAAVSSAITHFVAEIPLYFEAGQRYPADFVSCVACPEGLQVERLASNRGLAIEVAQKIIQSQSALSEKMAKSDHVIWNAGTRRCLTRQLSLSPLP